MNSKETKFVLFNLKKLKTQIVNDELPEKNGFIYLLIIVLVYSLSGYFKMLTSSFEAFGYGRLFYNWIEMLVIIPLIVICLSNAFAINKKIDNKSFLKRFVALSFVINARLIVLMLPLYVILAVIQEIFFLNSDVLDTIHLIVSILWSVLYFLFLIRSFQSVCKMKRIKE